MSSQSTRLGRGIHVVSENKSGGAMPRGKGAENRCKHFLLESDTPYRS